MQTLKKSEGFMPFKDFRKFSFYFGIEHMVNVLIIDRTQLAAGYWILQASQQIFLQIFRNLGPFLAKIRMNFGKNLGNLGKISKFMYIKMPMPVNLKC